MRLFPTATPWHTPLFPASASSTKLLVRAALLLNKIAPPVLPLVTAADSPRPRTRHKIQAACCTPDAQTHDCFAPGHKLLLPRSAGRHSTQASKLLLLHTREARVSRRLLLHVLLGNLLLGRVLQADLGSGVGSAHGGLQGGSRAKQHTW
jgi:hypothetical protein